MPIYEYECPDGHAVSLVVSIEDRDRFRTCPAPSVEDGRLECGQDLTRRVVPSSPAVALFQGPGFSRSSNMGKAR